MTLITDTLRHPGVTEAKSASDVAEWNALAAAMGDTSEKITAADSELDDRARRAVQEYSLNDDGITYAQQGYALPDGGIPYFKALEHLVIADTIAQERNSRHGRN